MISWATSTEGCVYVPIDVWVLGSQDIHSSIEIKSRLFDRRLMICLMWLSLSKRVFVGKPRLLLGLCCDLSGGCCDLSGSCCDLSSGCCDLSSDFGDLSSG